MIDRVKRTMRCGSCTVRPSPRRTAPMLHQQQAVETSRTVIRAASLRLLPDVHARSIYQLVWLGPGLLSQKNSGKTHLGCGFALRCFQRLSLLDVAIQPWPRQANWLTSGPAISVLSYWR